MNQFLIDGIPYREVFRNVGTEHEERGGCCQVDDGRNFCECEDCKIRDNCPADGEEE